MLGTWTSTACQSRSSNSLYTLQAKSMSQEVRSDMGTLLLKLTIKELFEWRFMQTDPNWGNFLYDEASGGLPACFLAGGPQWACCRSLH